MKVNPIQCFNARRVMFLPIHFHSIDINISHSMSVDSWILNNLKNRYYIGKAVSMIDGKSKVHLKIAFEDNRELSLFVLKYCSSNH